MKVLKMKNGLALVAVIVLLFVLTLLVPAMFTYAESATSIAVKGTARQRAVYIARTGVEMALATYRSTFNDASYTNSYMKAYEDLKAGSYPNDEMKMQRIWLYIRTYTDASDKQVTEPVYVTSSTDQKSGQAGYQLVGFCDVTVTYSDVILYYDNATEQQVPMSTATQTVNEIFQIKTGYTRVSQSMFRFSGVAFSGGVSGRKSANIIEMKDLSADGSVTYIDPASTDQSDQNLLEWLLMKDIWSHSGTGGNQAFIRSDLATARQRIDWEETSSATGDNTYVTQDMLVYSATGNMKYNLSGTDSKGNKLVFGVFPGLNYEDDTSKNVLDVITYRPSSADNVILGVNYDKGQTITEEQLATRGDLNDNFVAFACSGVLEFNADIDLRVNPASPNPLDGRNLSMYKFLSFGAPDIVVGGSVKMMISFYPAAGDGKRMSTVMLNAPGSTGYRYFNQDRNKSVKAGKVYFLKDVTAYIVNYNEDGHYVLGGSRTYPDNKFIKKTIFKSGDTYLFNAEVPYDDPATGGTVPGGVSLLNWYIETIYSPALAAEEKSWYQISKRAFSRYMNSTTDTYVKDDMHYVGNLNVDNISVPSAASSLYVVWDN